MTDREFWIGTWSGYRAGLIEDYQEAKQRSDIISRQRLRDLRRKALHYGQLVRKLERG